MDAFPETAAMDAGPGLTVRLSGDAAAFIAKEVAAGRYPDTGAAVAGLVEARLAVDEAAYFRAEYTRELIQIGVEQVARGEGIVVSDLAAHFAQLESEVEAELR